jgi:glucose/mannose transport system substrate-binding protein
MGPMRSRLTRRSLLAGSGGALFTHGVRAQGQSVEVLHWWVSGGEGDAIKVIRRRVEAHGQEWIDTAVQGPDVAKAAALTRVVGGNPPTVMLWHAGEDLTDLVHDGIIRDVEADAEGWGAVLPHEIDSSLKVDGKYVAVPADLHCGNWTFANTKLLSDATIEVPLSWPAVLAASARLQRSGVIPIAFGGQAWQESSVFVMILTGVGGARLLRRFTSVHDLGPADDSDLAAAFEIFAALKPYVDKANVGRSSTDTANLFATNKAALYFSGDWSRGDVNKAGMRPGLDYTCRQAPGNDGIFMAVVDAFCMPRTDSPAVRKAQDDFARIVMSTDVQHDFNLVKGSIPPRTDVDLSGYDAFALASAELARGRGDLVPSTSMGMTTSMRLGFYDVVHRFWNTDDADPKSAARDFRAAIDRNRG